MASGEIIEVGDSAGIRANTGSISLDRTVYPVPWGVLSNFGGDTGATTPNSFSVFPIHKTGLGGDVDDRNAADDADIVETIGGGDLIIHVRVNDPDLDISPTGEDTLGTNTAASQALFDDDNDFERLGPVKISVTRGSNTVVLAYAGGESNHFRSRN